MKQTLKNIFFLGIKELRGLFRDYMLLILIVYSFTLGVYITGNTASDTITKAAIAVVDEDHSQLSKRITDAFFPPMFLPAESIKLNDIDPAMDEGKYTFVLVIPPDFEKDVLAGRKPEIQLNIDATRMSQAFSGGGYIQQIISREVAAYVKNTSAASTAVETVIRNRYNANLTQSWFKAVMQLVSNITMLAIILTGAALIKERENGTLEHLLVMPVTAFEIMFSKVWSMMLVVLAASMVSIIVVIMQIMSVPVNGSLWLFGLGVALHLFAVTALGIFLACIARNMPQLGMLLILVLLPMQMLSGSSTPMESMPHWVQKVMQAAPTTHFVEFCQAIIFRGAGMDVVWKPFAKLFVIGSILFVFSLQRFRKSVAQ
ncbi:MAG: ABC transporter permease [Lentisphaeria bacterium]|nr:ABC transporter permease [Lentisphaeria bacterium]